MPTSPDGILTAEFDTTRGAVLLTVDGDEWSSPVTYITVTRTPLGQPTVPVRGLELRSVTGGWYIGSDGEMPHDTDVTYAVTGYDSLGAVVETTSVTESTAGAEWGVWLKAPGRVDFNQRVKLADLDPVNSATQGGTYAVIGGNEVSETSGIGADRTALRLQTDTAAQDAALQSLLRQYRDLQITTGQPAEIGEGTGADWWHVESHSRANPGRTRSDVYAPRVHTIQVVRQPVPAGAGLVSTGATYSDVSAAYATYTALSAAVSTYADLMNPGV